MIGKKPTFGSLNRFSIFTLLILLFFTIGITSQDDVGTKIEASIFGNLYDKFMKMFYAENRENETRNDVDDVSGSIITSYSMENSGHVESEDSYQMKSLVNETREESTTTVISAEIVTEPTKASAFQNLYDKFMKIFYPGNQENETRNNVDEVFGSIIATNSMENSRHAETEDSYQMKILVNETQKESTTTIISAETVTETTKPGVLEKLYDKIGNWTSSLTDKTKNATSTTTVISVTTTTGPPSETLFKNWYHRMEKLLEKFTNGTKDRLDEVRAEVQYCQAKIDFNKKLAETISGKRIFLLQTLKQSYDMIKEYWKLKEEGKKFKLCRDRSLLSWEVTVGRSWLKGLIIGSK